MSEPIRYSTREVRQRIGNALRRHFLPLLLTLLIAGLPLIAAGVLHGVSTDYSARAAVVSDEALALQESHPDGMNDAQQREFIALCSEHSRLKGVAGACFLASAALLFLSVFTARPLLYGADLTAVTILRGGDFSWRDALLTWSEFRQGFKLGCYSFLCLLMTAIPGYLVRLLGDFVHNVFGLTNLANLIATLGAIIMIVMVFVRMLRFLIAPRLLADGAEGTAAELIQQSTEILDLPALLPMLSILFPGFVMAAAALLLQTFVLSALLPGWLSGLLAMLLLIPAWGWLFMGGAAIYVTFRRA